MQQISVCEINSLPGYKPLSAIYLAPVRCFKSLNISSILLPLNVTVLVGFFFLWEVLCTTCTNIYCMLLSFLYHMFTWYVLVLPESWWEEGGSLALFSQHWIPLLVGVWSCSCQPTVINHKYRVVIAL